MVKDNIIMLTDDFHMNNDIYNISYCYLNEKIKHVPFVIKYIYEDQIKLLKIAKYKHNENYILSFKNFVDEFDDFIVNTNIIEHNNTNKFIIGLKYMEFNNYNLKEII